MPQKKKKKKRTERPFKPGNPDALDINDVIPVCGEGKEVQIDVHVVSASTNNLALFDIAPQNSGVHFPELAGVTRELNAVFNKRVKPALDRRRRETGIKKLEVTIALVKGQLYITYARRVRKRPTR
jgi:hypothetical protein